MTYEPVWGVPIALYLFLAGLGGGAFITSAFLALRHPQATNMRRVGHVIAPVVVAVGLVLLMVDAKAGFQNPLRFVLLLTNLGSVMTWGVVFLAAFEVVAIVALVLDVLKRPVPMALELAGAVLGVCVGAYTGCLLGVANTFPLWNNALLPVLFLVSATSTGMASVLLVSVFRNPEEFNQVGVLKKFHYCLPIIEFCMLASLMFITHSVSDAGAASVDSLISGRFAPLFWLCLVLLGLVVATVLETWLLFFTSKEFEESKRAHMISAFSDAGVLIGGYVLRFLVIAAALPVTLVVPYL